MAKQNVELQLMALERLKQELESLVKDIENRGNSYVASVKALMQTDLDVNVANQYKNNYWQHNNALMAQLKQRIETQWRKRSIHTHPLSGSIHPLLS